MISNERQLEDELCDLKCEHHTDIRDRAAFEDIFREKFETLNPVSLTPTEFQQLLDEIVNPDFNAGITIRNRNSQVRDEGTPLNYTMGDME